MKLVKYALVALLLSGCAGGTLLPQSPQQSVFAAKAGYEVALTVAVAYRKLPSCGISSPPCSDAKIVAQLQKTQPAARASLDAAEEIVRLPGWGDDAVSSAVAAANSALKAFTTITSTLQVK